MEKALLCLYNLVPMQNKENILKCTVLIIFYPKKQKNTGRILHHEIIIPIMQSIARQDCFYKRI